MRAVALLFNIAIYYNSVIRYNNNNAFYNYSSNCKDKNINRNEFEIRLYKSFQWNTLVWNFSYTAVANIGVVLLLQYSHSLNLLLTMDGLNWDFFSSTLKVWVKRFGFFLIFWGFDLKHKRSQIFLTHLTFISGALKQIHKCMKTFHLAIFSVKKLYL